MRKSVKELQQQVPEWSRLIAPANVELQGMIVRISAGTPHRSCSHCTYETCPGRSVDDGIHVERLEELVPLRSHVRKIHQRPPAKFPLEPKGPAFGVRIPNTGVKEIVLRRLRCRGSRRNGGEL